MEDLQNQTLDAQSKCAACMVGKATVYPDFILVRKEQRILWSLERVCMDSFSSSLQFFEGWNYALKFIDDATGYRWLNGKSKNENVPVQSVWI
jgi:hypothetical protein